MNGWMLHFVLIFSTRLLLKSQRLSIVDELFTTTFFSYENDLLEKMAGLRGTGYGDSRILAKLTKQKIDGAGVRKWRGGSQPDARFPSPPQEYSL